MTLEGLRSVKLLVSLVLAASLLVSGCGVYSLSGRGQSEISTISIEPFENDTNRYELTDRLTETIVDAFISDGNLKVVPGQQADALLQGSLLTYKREPYKFDENDQVQQYKVVMGFQVSLLNPREDTQYWSEQLNMEGIYDANTETEEDGQQRAAQRLVDAIINKTTKSW